MTDRLAGGDDESQRDAPAAATTGRTGATGDRPVPAGRASKWDRPPAPHDWRYFGGNLGKVLISCGVLLFGFVAYQLWGTGIATARAQNQLEDQFDALVAEADATPGTTPSGSAPVTLPISDATEPTTATPTSTTTTATTPTSTTAPTPVTTPESAPTGATSPGSGGSTDGSDATEPGDGEATDLPPIERGGPLAKLEIPRIGLSSIVVPGVALDDLADGPGHYPDTPLPGQLGNAAIAGHRTTHGAPFFDIDQLEAGDEIIVTMISGDRFVYEVTGSEIVQPSDYWVVATTDPTVAELTLTSCHPKYEARERLIVHSVLVPEESAPLGEPTYYEIDEQPNVEIPGDDPVVTGGNDDVSSGPAEGAELTSEPPEVAADATLTGGWFEDPDAFAHIAFWGSLLILIALAAHRLSRRVRHDSVGFAAGIVPFVLVLYFFYENVSRLLPPGL